MNRSQAPSSDSDRVTLVASTPGTWSVDFMPSDRSGRPIHFQVTTLRPAEGAQIDNPGPPPPPPPPPSPAPAPAPSPPRPASPAAQSGRGDSPGVNRAEPDVRLSPDRNPEPPAASPAAQSLSGRGDSPGVNRAEPDVQLSPDRNPESPAASPAPFPQPSPLAGSTASLDASFRAGPEADVAAPQYVLATPKSSGPPRVHWDQETPSKQPSRSSSRPYVSSPITVSDSEPSRGAASSSPSHSDSLITTPLQNAMMSAGCSIQVGHYRVEHNKRMKRLLPKHEQSEALSRAKGERTSGSRPARGEENKRRKFK
ncbi:hypothetical protein BV25DRAFT_1842564 [Artomyces pyxidatus]|uniref:Uncharacterized protein n=1 Tax=Artomyces pyxidatus TaxID=48021 RepID=A0ACB8SIH6_9AGAM|nr:hypothetical protein BV25DRAFT_1842564 [Artomyces pyxidatus]